MFVIMIHIIFLYFNRTYIYVLDQHEHMYYIYSIFNKKKLKIEIHSC